MATDGLSGWSGLSGLSRLSGEAKETFSQDAQSARPARPQPKNRPQAYPLGYVEDLFEGRTPLAGIFSILLGGVRACSLFSSLKNGFSQIGGAGSKE